MKKYPHPLEDSLIDFNPWPMITLLLFVLGIYFGTLIEKTRYDMPEEFNQYTISRDTAHPTEMMVIYNERLLKYTFEFTDK